MQRFEYKVLPAPKRGEKVRGLKTTEDRFAHALTQLMNDLGADGWDYVRADTLPCEERVGFTGKSTSFQHMLIFRRVLSEETAVVPMAVADVETPVLFSRQAPAVLPPLHGGAPALGPARPDVAAE
ncbi:MAG: DUF4177 domain-containing protein [Paracoccaceae bacterium]